MRKRRMHFTVSGAMAELSELTVDGRATRTIAVELEDPVIVIAAVRELGLVGRPNTCMARGIKAFLGRR